MKYLCNSFSPVFIAESTLFVLCVGTLCTGDARAVTTTSLRDQGAEALYGRYAPEGDCKREPRITVDEAGFAFEMAGKTTRTTTFEHAVSYGGDSYEGISDWFFPFIAGEGNYPVLMTFNADEKKGRLVIEPHDEGWKGRPPLTPFNAMLVKGSPYVKCAQ